MATPITPQAVTKQKREAAAAEYEAATKGLKFSKDFNTNLEAIIADPMATWAERLTAWLKRYAWGEYSLWAIREDGNPRTLADAARELCRPEDKLRSVRSRVYDASKYLETRDYLRIDGEKIYPVIAPKASLRGPKVYGAYSDFSAFLEQYKVSHSDAFAEYEAARAIVKTIRKNIISEFKKFRKRSQGASEKVHRERVTERTGSECISDSVSLLPKIQEDKKTIHAHETAVTDQMVGARAFTPLLLPAPETPAAAGAKVHGAYSDSVNQSKQEIPLSPLKRLDEFLGRYPDKADRDSTARAYAKYVTAETEDACHACLARYLSSDRVARNVVQRGRNWIEQQARNGFHGEWVFPKPPQSSKGFVDSVTRVIGTRLAKGEKPW